MKCCSICGKQASEFRNDVRTANKGYVQLGTFGQSFDIGVVLCEDCSNEMLSKIVVMAADLLLDNLNTDESENIRYLLDLGHARKTVIEQEAILNEIHRCYRAELETYAYELDKAERKIRILENKNKRMVEEYNAKIGRRSCYE